MTILLRLPLAACFCGSLRVPPPYGGERRHAIFRHWIRTTETVPPRCPQFAVAPLRHDEVIPEQNAVKRLGGGDQVVACLGGQYLRDRLVNRRVLDSEDVVRP